MRRRLQTWSADDTDHYPCGRCERDRARSGSVFDQRMGPIITKFVAEGFRVVATVSGETLRVARISAGDLWANHHVVSLRGRRVDVGDVQRFYVHERSDFQRSNAVVRPVGVVATGLVTVKASRIDMQFGG